MRVTWLIHTCDMTHSCVWHDSFIRVTWRIHMCDMTPFTCFHICDMTHSYVWHDSFISETWLIHMCGMTHSYVSHDSFICVTWRIHMCDKWVRCHLTHQYVWHDWQYENPINTYKHTWAHMKIYENTRMSQMWFLFSSSCFFPFFFFLFPLICYNPKSTISRNSNIPVQIQNLPKFVFQFVPRDTEECEFLELMDFGGVALSVETER